MNFQLGIKTRKQFGEEVSIAYLIKDKIIQTCPDRNDMCSNICPFFSYDNITKTLQISCKSRAINIKIEGEREVNEC